MSSNNSIRPGRGSTFQQAEFRNISSLHTPTPAASKHDLNNLSLWQKG